MNDTQRRARERSDAITAALADVDKGRYGIEHHRWVVTQERVRDGRTDDRAPEGGWLVTVHAVEWCWDCGTRRDEAEQRPYPSAWPPGVGFCGYTAKQPGPWWEQADLGVVTV